ncbi:MAG: nicotinate-nucleotide adenylyltransferase [Betaproteobacteria bacterium]|nr:nicotinate-nucleotide adenylyltransferase [Betaproteobacteria bacterium]
MNNPRSIGLFGGTFDPIHFGHLRIAEEVADYLALAELRFIPAANPLLRQPPVAAPGHRLAMVRLAIEGNPRFSVDERELRRHGPSYTVETLEELRKELGEQARLHLVIGADAFHGLAGWHRWERLFELAHVVIAARPGHGLDHGGIGLGEALGNEWRSRVRGAPEALRDSPAGAILCVPTSLLDISASRIRRLLARGESVRYLLPGAVLDYIQANRIYAGD